MQSGSRKDQTLTAVVFTVVGFGMLIVGIYLGWRSQQSLEGKARAEAVVTHVMTHESDDNVEYFPTVAFTTAAGEKIESTPATFSLTSALGGLVTVNTSDDGYETAYEVGDEVEVFYSLDNPNEVVLNDFNMLWVAPLVVGCLGALFLLLGVLVGIMVLVRGQRT